MRKTRNRNVFVAFVGRIPREYKRLLMISADSLFVPIALWSAITLRRGTPIHEIQGLFWLYAAALVVSIPIFARLGLYRAVVRYIGPRALSSVLIGTTISVGGLGAVNYLFLPQPITVYTLVIYWLLSLMYVGGSRLLIRVLLLGPAIGHDRVVIYGAGTAGAQLANSLSVSGHYRPIAFIDDNPSLHGSVVSGIEILPPSELASLVKEKSVAAVLLALPSQSRRRRYEILKGMEQLGVLVKTVPDVSDLVSGIARVDEIRDVDASDLLGRDPVPPNEGLMDACIRGKMVMVSGAGGSIGSELCRQILQLAPARLVLLEMSEVALYNIERELRQLIARLATPPELVGLLGNAHHKQRVREIMQAYGIQTVYHAAAYKHVPIVEQNIVEGIHNNVFSTWYAAEAAVECGVETFVLISTDKAVNPTNVMGATKRMAEIVLQGLHARGSATRLCVVRFGNVLESSGSVVPLFREQIRNGGPITVTHKDVIRYFMTIPEASQLVLQAGSMAKGGDVFVLDMGKPVRIEDLARRMIGLMGFSVRDHKNPDGDIEIVYTGLRPAEKLFEELLIGTNVTGTEHPMIMRATEHHLPWPAVAQLLDDLLQAIDAFDCNTARELLMQAVAEYRPGNDVQDLVWMRKRAIASQDLSNVTALAARRAKIGH